MIFTLVCCYMNKQQNKLNDKAHYNIWIILAVYGSVLIVYSYREGYVICKTFEMIVHEK